MVRPRREGEGDSDTRVRNGRFKGVRMRKWGKWVAEVRQPNSRGKIWLGSYKTAEEAARAYDAAAFCLRGTSAELNFPGNPPEIPGARDLLTPTQIQDAAFKHSRRAAAEDAEPAGELGVLMMGPSSGCFAGTNGGEGC